MSEERILYTVKEVATLLKVDPHYVYRLIDSGVLPAIKLNSTKVRKESLYKFLKDYEGFDLSNPNAPYRIKSDI